MIRWDNESQARSEIKAMITAYYKDFIDKKHVFEHGDRIAYAARVFDQEEMCALTDALLDFWLTSGRFAERFEQVFAEFLNVENVSLVNSGSSANLLAFMALTSPELQDRQIKRGDEIITVACSFPTTVSPIIQYGAVPVFIDITIPQYNIDCSMLEAAYSEKTKAVIVAHTLGNPFNIEEVKRFCDKHNLWLIEDNCDALGSRYLYHGALCYTGTIGDIATSSFYPPHHITMGEGGCVYTNDARLSRLIRSFRDWGRDCVCAAGQDNFCKHRFEGQHGILPYGYDHKYVYSHFGYNLKATDMQAAIGCAQMKKLPNFIQRRRENWEYMRARLNDLSHYFILPEPQSDSSPSWFGFLLTIQKDCGLIRNQITSFLESKNIQTRLLFSGNLIKHPCFDALRETSVYRVVGSLENTDYVMNNSFWLGVYPGMTSQMLDYIADMVHEFVDVHSVG